ncbi:MazG-like family protein [Candidatus Peregrinibacteria bacterium]|nr:MazG-like family protein [Candidatus Peregrinibacteria bacterium]
MKSLQAKIKTFCRNNHLESPVEHRVLDTMSELGEVAKEVLKMTNYGRKPLEFREEIKSELGDVLYSLITIANTFDIDLEESVNGVLAKYEKRLLKGSAGSEVDQ